MPSLNKDVHLTAQFLIFLRAGYFGQIMFHTALSKMQSTFLPENYTDISHKAFDKIDPWMADLQQGLPIFATAWQAPETFDAISAFGFLKELKRDLTLLIPQIEQALQVQNLTSEREATKLLAACIMRSASVRNAYVESSVQTYTALNAGNIVQQISPEAPGAQEYLRVAQTIVDTFSSPAAFETDLCERLRKEALLTPGDFRAHIHDANILLNAFSKEFTFEMAEFSQADADGWTAYRIPAVMAGYWKAYDFTPDGCMEWQRVGVVAGPLAANWRRAGFEPARAIEWLKEGFTPALAVAWDKAGYEPPRAAALLRRGITDPTHAPRDSHGGDEEQDAEQDVAV
jgi:hypothetical protein